MLATSRISEAEQATTLNSILAEQRYISSVQSTLQGNDHTAAAADARSELQAWLGKNRLHRHLKSIIDIVGRDATPEDLKLLMGGRHGGIF
jgi:hypothetical protein